MKAIRTLSVRLGSVALGSAMLLATGTGCEKADAASAAPAAVQTVASASSAGAQDGQRWFSQSCASCHGFNGQGMPRQGASLRTSQFISDQSDDELVAFIKSGRAANDPKSVMKLVMPAKGNNPTLTDRQIQQIVSYLRQMQEESLSSQTASAAR